MSRWMGGMQHALQCRIRCDLSCCALWSKCFQGSRFSVLSSSTFCSHWHAQINSQTVQLTIQSVFKQVLSLLLASFWYFLVLSYIKLLCLSLYCRSNALLHPCGNFTGPTGQALEVPCGSIFSSAYAAVSSKGAFRLNVITCNEAKCGTGTRYKTWVQIRFFRCFSISLSGSCVVMLRTCFRKGRQ